MPEDLPYRLRLPGPTPVPERITRAMTAPILAHRGPEFHEIVKETAERAQTVFGTRNKVMFTASSGTGVMEAALVNVLADGDKALVINHGQFGDRFVKIADAHGFDTDELTAPWGEAVPMEAIAAQLEKSDYKAVIAVHNESSTGAVADLAGIGKIVKDTPAVLLVDSVSGLAGLELRQDEWGVDVVVSASQKALMCPPGAGLMSVSEKAWKIIDDGRARRRFYWDLRKARNSAEKNETTTTSPIPLIMGLREALRMIGEEGWDKVRARHARLAAAMRAGGEALGLPVFTRAPLVSSTVAVFEMPEGRDSGEIVRHMKQQYGTVIAGIRHETMKGKLIRIGTMGACTEADIRTDLDYLERTLADLGWPVEKGAARAAADDGLRKAS